ncbi:unnamed protein product, partial [Owenia fusiformis]
GTTEDVKNIIENLPRKYSMIYIQVEGNEASNLIKCPSSEKELQDMAVELRDKIWGVAEKAGDYLFRQGRVIIGKIPCRWVTPITKKSHIKSIEHAKRCNTLISNLNKYMNDKGKQKPVELSSIIYWNSKGLVHNFRELLEDDCHFNDKGLKKWKKAVTLAILTGLGRSRKL